MNKKSAAAALAAMMIMSLTGCGSEDSSAAESAGADAEANISSAEAEGSSSEIEGSSAQAEGSKSDTGESAEETEPTAENTLVDGVYTGNGYTFNIDEDLWSDQSIFSNGVDCAFVYNAEITTFESTANFNILVQTDSEFETMTAESYAELLSLTYKSSEGYDFISQSPCTVNGIDGYRIEVSIAQDDVTMSMAQLIMIEKDTIYCISYGAEASVFGSMQDAFDDVFNTFSIV